MKTKKSLLVVPAIALVFAFVFTTCSNGSTGGGGNQGSTQGQLAFERITDGENAGTWRVRKGTVTSRKVVIPAYYNGTTGRAARSAEDGDPVTEIGANYDTDGNGAFSGADITEIIIPDTIKRIGLYAFQGCPNLSAITIPASVEIIGAYVFASNSKLTSINVETGNPNYISEGGILYQISGGGGGDGFSWFASGYDDDYWGKALHSWPSAKGSVITPSGVKTIFPGAFDGNQYITSVTISEGVDYVFSSFSYCPNLTSISIPASLTDWHDIMLGCPNLTSITVAPGNPYFSAEGGILYYNDGGGRNYVEGNALIAWPSAKGNITIPAGVEVLNGAVFLYNRNITGVTIPESVKRIQFNTFAFSTNIKSITIPASVTSIGDGAFAYWTSSQIIYVDGHASQAAADAAWITGGARRSWRSDCNAVIKYWNGSSYQ